MNTTNADFDRWFFAWRCDHDAGPAVNLWPLKDAYEAGYRQARVDESSRITEMLHCGFREGVTHHCALRPGHFSPHQMIQTSERGATR